MGSTTKPVTPDDLQDGPNAAGQPNGEDDARTRVIAQNPATTTISRPSLASQYSVMEKIGDGGMGVVYLARQRSLRREVALKVIHTSAKPTEGDTLQALLREARIAGSLEHPNIVPVHWLGRDKDNQPQMVMKRVGGVPWADLIRQDHVAGGAGISEEKTVRHLEIDRKSVV